MTDVMVITEKNEARSLQSNFMRLFPACMPARMLVYTPTPHFQPPLRKKGKTRKKTGTVINYRTYILLLKMQKDLVQKYLCIEQDIKITDSDLAKF